jgi:hypothetical protein
MAEKNSGRKFYYNHLFAARMKNIGLALILIIFISIFFFQMVDEVESHRDPGSEWYFPPALSLLVFIIVIFIRVGHVLEKTSATTLDKYFQVGPLKVNAISYHEIGPARIEQDERKFYLISMEHSKGKMILAKYPALDTASFYLASVNEFLDRSGTL